MANDNQVRIDITAEVQGFNANMAAAQANLERIAGAFDKTGAATRDYSKHSEAAEAATNKLAGSTSNLTGLVKQAAAAFGLYKIAEYAKDAALLNARYETLGISMTVVGKNAGYNAAQMEDAAVAMQKTGISMVESRQQAMRLVQAHIDLAQSTQLARIAQDAAVIGNMNSSEAFAAMIHGIQTGQTDVLRTIGLNISMEQSYKLMAQQLHKNADALTQNEKTQAILNAVMLAGADIAGTYEAAMGTAGKQLNSMTRYLEDVKVKQGEVFNELLTVGVMAFTEHLKDANGELDEMAKNNQLEEWGNDLTDVFVGIANAINNIIVMAKLAAVEAAHLAQKAGGLAGAGAVGGLKMINPMAGRIVERALDVGVDKSEAQLYEEETLALSKQLDKWDRSLEARRAATAEKRSADTAKKRDADLKSTTDYMAKVEALDARYFASRTMTAKQYDAEMAKLANGDKHQYKDTASATKDAAAESAIKHANDFIKSLKLQDEQLGLDAAQKKAVEAATIALTVKSEALRMKIMESAGAFAAHYAAQQSAIEAEKTQAAAVDALNKKYDEMEMGKSDAIKSTNDYVISLGQGNQQREMEIGLMGQSEAARNIAIGQYQIERDLQAQILKIKMATTDEDERAKQIASATDAASRAKDSVAQYVQINEQMKDWNAMWGTVERTGKDAFVHLLGEGKGAFEGIGKALKASVIDLLYQLTARRWIVSIGTSVAGSLGMAGTANAAGTAAGGGSDLLSMGSNAYSLFNGGMSVMGDYALGAMGLGSGLTQGAMLAAQTAEFGLAGATATAEALGGVAGSMGGLTTALSAIPGWGWAAMGALALFGGGAFGGKEEVSGQGVTMDVRGTSALGGSWTSYHRDGGWFGDDNNRKTGAPLADAQMAAVSATLTGVRTVVKGLADELGDPSILRRLDDFSASYNGASDGLDAWLRSVTESMLATALPGLEQFRRAGENTQSVIARLAQTLQAIESLNDAIDSQIGVMSGGASQYGYDLAIANRAVSDLYETLGNTVDIQARVEIEGQLYQQVLARYQLEQQYLGELSGVLTQSLQSVRDVRAAVGGSLSGVAGTPAPTVAELREAIAGSVAGLSLPSMQPVFDANLAMQQAAADFTAESDRIAESNKEIRTYIGGWEVNAGAANGGEQVAEFNVLMDMARNAGILAAGTMNYINYRDSNVVISLRDGYRFTLDGAGIGQTANITHGQDWMDVNGIGWSRFERTIGMEYYKPQGYEQVGAGVTDAVTATAAAYQQAQDDFTAAMQAFAGDASQATEKLQGLREETLKYYDTQQQLADLMRQTAEALGQTISSLNRANMVPVSRYEDMRAEFDRLYAGAASLGGADLAARAAQLNSLAQPLMDAARESYASSPAYQAALASITGSLADLQARLGAEAPRDYQAESLALLSGIDAALGYIETSLVSADQQIVAAINASRDSTVAVLQDIRTLLGGEQTTLSGLPGHADGLSYVPYDNYGARLHLGEGVIDAGTMAGLRRYGIGGGAGGGSPEQLAEQRNTTEELRALVRLQSTANQALLEKLEAMEKRLAGIESKSRMAAAA